MDKLDGPLMSSGRSVVSNNNDDESKGLKPYVVGYGKPPVHTRFKKGQSGNPNGRHKGSKNFSTTLEETLQEKVVIREKRENEDSLQTGRHRETPCDQGCEWRITSNFPNSDAQVRCRAEF
jgi:hypothetical protein